MCECAVKKQANAPSKGHAAGVKPPSKSPPTNNLGGWGVHCRGVASKKLEIHSTETQKASRLTSELKMRFTGNNLPG